ncbi:MAG: site-specific integrase [Gallionellaceae bacterium]|jgi:integrase
MASKRKRSTGSWEYVVKRKGLLPKPINLTFDSEVEGDAYVAHLEKLLDAGIVPDDFKEKAQAIATIGESIKAYFEAVHITDDDIGWLKAMAETIGSRSLDRVTYAWVEDWVKELQAGGGAPSTIRKKVGALARCLDWVVRKQGTMLAANPLRMLPKRYATTATGRKDEERDRRLQEGEEPRILVILDRQKPEGRQRALALPYAEAFKLMFTLSLETAMRMREVYTLEVEQIHLDKRTIFLEKTKNGDKRQVPLSSVAVSAIKDYLTTHSGERLFPFWDGNHSPAALRTMSNRLSHQWHTIFEAARCEGLRYHDLRHEATSRFFERTTMSDVEIAKITGHSSTQMLMRYANLRGSSLAAKLW